MIDWCSASESSCAYRKSSYLERVVVEKLESFCVTCPSWPPQHASTSLVSLRASLTWLCAFPSSTLTALPPSFLSTSPTCSTMHHWFCTSLPFSHPLCLFRYLLDMPRVKHIVPDPDDPALRLLILSDAIANPGALALPCFAPSFMLIYHFPVLSCPCLAYGFEALLPRFARPSGREETGGRRDCTSGYCFARGGP